MCQFLIAQNVANGTFAFDQSEFSRLPNLDTMHQVTFENLQQVTDVLHQSLTVDAYSRVVSNGGLSRRFIDAQFKNMNM